MTASGGMAGAVFEATISKAMKYLCLGLELLFCLVCLHYTPSISNAPLVTVCNCASKECI